MAENLATIVIGLGFLAFPIMAFKIIYDDIKRDKKASEKCLNCGDLKDL